MRFEAFFRAAKGDGRYEADFVLGEVGLDIVRPGNAELTRWNFLQFAAVAAALQNCFAINSRAGLCGNGRARLATVEVAQ